jgi:hypothetical protein
LDVATFFPLPWGIKASVRATYGTGTPFWPFGGYITIARLTTITGNLHWDFHERLPFWSSEQMRMPQYLRVDLGVRGRFDAFGARFEPSLGFLNATARPNVLYYRPEIIPAELDVGDPIPLVPQTLSRSNLILSAGLNVYF